MRSANKKYALIPGLTAVLFSANVMADADGDKICSAITRANIGAPANEVYLGVFGRIKSTYKPGGEGTMVCSAVSQADGNCKPYTETNNLLNKTIQKNGREVPDPNAPYGQAVIGFSKMGGEPVTYHGIATGGGQEGAVQMSYALCENGASIDAALKKEVIACWNGGAQFLYGPEPGYLDVPRKKYTGFRGTPASSDSGEHIYKVSFQGLIEKNDANLNGDSTGKKGCERLVTKDNPPVVITRASAVL